MQRTSSGYSKSMFKLLKRLRKLGLPENLFDVDFAEREQANRESHDRLLEKLRQMENSDEWSGIELPWKQAREDFEKRVAEGEEIAYVATQPIVSVWHMVFIHNFMDWHNRWRDQKERDKRKLERQSKKEK